ncbi:glycoside hydrolase family 2 protein [Leptolyngbya sp. Heron Island J]|uniref:glycoside hydrolase family 2 protein n=1 Tax=Leptolyngbya sp. Heron Island J TaxID=1385935 RepID=UPI00041F4C67|nr:glycoside hydrolase family 2 TIM barrel-domain containing protein [Leptolyngbya sp. Heron Island J]
MVDGFTRKLTHCGQRIAIALVTILVVLGINFQSNPWVDAHFMPDMGESSNHFSLNGTWRIWPETIEQQNRPSHVAATNNTKVLPDFSNITWQDIYVPANWYLQGHDLHDVVWYQRIFEVPQSLINENNVVKLVFEGIDYEADVWLNGHYLGSHQGYFEPFDFRVNQLLNRDSSNILTVRVNSPLEEQDQDWSLHKRFIKGIFAHHDTRPGGAWTKRGQEKNTGGIWAPVYLQSSNTLAIDNIQVTPKLNHDGSHATADVVVELDYQDTESQEITLDFQLVPENFLGDAGEHVRIQQRIHPDNNSFRIHLEQNSPKLWWSWEHGDPNLYRLKLKITDSTQLLDQHETVFGFRSVEWDHKQQIWKLNNKRLFLRGTNYIASQWLSEMTADKYLFDIGLMKKANINAVRVHAHITGQEFYEGCDRNGLLVWQDFPLQWGYVDDSRFREEAIRQGKAMIQTLYNHPSIFAWSLHNEPPWDADWMQYKYKTYDPQQNYQLDQALFNGLKGYDPSRYLHQASLTSEHPWWGWYSNTFEKYAEPTEEPLITEFGAQALPDINVLRRIFSEDELWPDNKSDWAKWEYHNFQQHETFNLAQVPMGKTLNEFVNNTQQYQAVVNQFASEAYRRQKYQPVSGIFQFMFTENWPSINWGIVDYWRTPKPAFEALRRAYQPLLPSIEWTQQRWHLGEKVNLPVWLINDLWEDFPNAQITFSLSHQNKVIDSRQFTHNIPADSRQRLSVANYAPTQLGEYEFIVTLRDHHGDFLADNLFLFQIDPTAASNTDR